MRTTSDLSEWGRKGGLKRMEGLSPEARRDLARTARAAAAAKLSAEDRAEIGRKGAAARWAGHVRMERTSPPRRYYYPRPASPDSRAYRRDYYQRNAAHINDYMRKWRAAHPSVSVDGDVIAIHQLPSEWQAVALLIRQSRAQLKEV